MADTLQRMSRVDTAWLRMDNDVNLMMIVGVWLLRPGITLDALCDRIEDKLLDYERFRQRVVQDALGASWVTDTGFDLARHVLTETLVREKGQSERQALQALVAELANTPLDPDRPLWQFHLIDHYEGGSALVLRIHHCIGDGMALISVMLAITDAGTDRRKRRPDTDTHTHTDTRTDTHADAASGGAAGATAMPSDAHHGLFGALEALASRGPLDLARSGVRALGDAAALALMPDDSPTRLKGKPIGQKVVAWSEPMPLDDVKAVGKGLDCSINDVLLACVAGAIGQYLRDQGDDTSGQEIRAMVPVNLRPLEDAWQLGNRFGLAPLTMPIGIDNPIERVYAVRARMNQLKDSYQPLLAFAVLSVAGGLLKPLQDGLLGLFAKKATAVMTNVPGPAVPLKFCGATLRQTMFWVPASGDIGVGLSILSYGGGVQFGLITDKRLCPDPQAIIDRFEPEFEKLLLVTMMLPWAEADKA